MCDVYYGDQSSYWSAYKSYYGANHVISHWINVDIDYDEDQYGSLFSAANSLGINTLYLYALQSGTPKLDHINHFCDRAWHNGWLRRFDVNVYFVYICDKPDPCTNCDHTIATDWSFYELLVIGRPYEVFP